MKKSIVILAALLIAGTASFAQHFDVGLKAGANIANFTGASNASDLKSKTYVGFYGGGFVSFYVGNNFAIQPEVLFSSQGAKYEQAGMTKDFKLTYITVPVMAKYRFNGGFYIEAGPQLGVKLDEKIDGNSSQDFAKSTDLSIAGGIGYHSSIGIGIGARYVAGLSKVGNFDIGTATPDWKNGVIQVGIFYTFLNSHKK